jgi:Zn-dependent peptidase ImmA (M78 family)
MASYSDEGFEQLAKTIRTELGIDDITKVGAIDFLRRLKNAGYINDYVRLPDSCLPDAEGKYNPDDKRISLRESAYRGAENDSPRHRFTVFHEGAHALLGHQYERKRSVAARATAEKKVPSIRWDEGDADKLAVAIIAPFHKANFALETTPAQIATRFGLSSRAASRRYDEFAGIYRRANKLRRPLPKGVSDFLTEQRRRGFIVTSLPVDEIAAIKPQQHSYTGDACPNPNCGQFKMMRNGTSLRCDSCGSATGDD